MGMRKQCMQRGIQVEGMRMDLKGLQGLGVKVSIGSDIVEETLSASLQLCSSCFMTAAALLDIS